MAELGETFKALLKAPLSSASLLSTGTQSSVVVDVVVDVSVVVVDMMIRT